jgi:hypothetical protein
MQLAWPEQSFKIFNLLGDKFVMEMANDIYLALVTIHGTNGFSLYYCCF